MRLIKFTHACVRLEDGDRRLLIDPGIWTEREAYQGVTDILVTHEHDDHIDIERITDLFESGSGSSCVVGVLWRVSRSGSSWCRWGVGQGGRRPVEARNPVMRSGWYCMLLMRLWVIRARSLMLPGVRLAIERFRLDHTVSVGLSSGARAGSG
jgi:hypothetical protein